MKKKEWTVPELKAWLLSKHQRPSGKEIGNTPFGPSEVAIINNMERFESIWEDFLTDFDIPFEMVRPDKKTTQLSPSVFKRITGYSAMTSKHSRAAAMMVFAK